MVSSSDKKIKSIVIKLIICVFFIAVLLYVETSLGYKAIPFNRVSINETKNDIKSKNQQVMEMNSELTRVSKKVPLLIKNGDKLTNNALIAVNKKEEGIIDIPSILVYLEQTGKNTGLIVKKIDIEGLNDTEKSMAANNKNIKKKLVITASGSYKSFCDYIKEIQINTKEKILIEGFKFTSNDSAMSTCKVEIEISL
ncbi:MAG: hypothetical protein ACM3UU_11175 [Ignavibacteriales bacterium]